MVPSSFGAREGSRLITQGVERLMQGRFFMELAGLPTGAAGPRWCRWDFATVCFELLFDFEVRHYQADRATERADSTLRVQRLVRNHQTRQARVR